MRLLLRCASVGYCRYFYALFAAENHAVCGAVILAVQKFSQLLIAVGFNNSYVGSGRIMLVLNSRRNYFFVFIGLCKYILVGFCLCKAAEHFGSYHTGSQYLYACSAVSKADNSAFDTVFTFAAVYYKRYSAVHIGIDVLCRCRTGASRQICRRSGKRNAAHFNKIQSILVVGHSDSNCIKPSACRIGNYILLRKNHRQRTAPEMLGKGKRKRRNLLYRIFQHIKVADVDNQRIVLRSAFSFEYLRTRIGVICVCRKAVYRFGRYRHDLALLYKLCRLAQYLVRRFLYLCFQKKSPYLC